MPYLLNQEAGHEQPWGEYQGMDLPISFRCHHSGCFRRVNSTLEYLDRGNQLLGLNPQ